MATECTKPLKQAWYTILVYHVMTPLHTYIYVYTHNSTHNHVVFIIIMISITIMKSLLNMIDIVYMYPLVIQHSYRNTFIVDLPMQHGNFPQLWDGSPEGISHHPASHIYPAI